MSHALDEMRHDGKSERRRRSFDAARRASARPVGRSSLGAALDWNRALRELFGDRSPSTRICPGGDYQI